MKLHDILFEEDIPDDAVPYETNNQSGTMRLSPFSNDIDPPKGFKDVDYLARLVDREIEKGNVQTREFQPNSRHTLATQYWITPEDIGAGDPVFHDLEDYPVIVNLRDGYFHVIDGHHRTDDAIRRRRKIPVYYFDLSDQV